MQQLSRRNLSFFFPHSTYVQLKEKYTRLCFSCFLKESRRQFPYLQFTIFQPIQNSWSSFMRQLLPSVIPQIFFGTEAGSRISFPSHSFLPSCHSSSTLQQQKPAAIYFLFWMSSMRQLTAQPPGCLGTSGWILSRSTQAGMTSGGLDGLSPTSFIT